MRADEKSTANDAGPNKVRRSTSAARMERGAFQAKKAKELKME